MKIRETLADLLKKPIKAYNRRKEEKIEKYATKHMEYALDWMEKHIGEKDDLTRFLLDDMQTTKSIPPKGVYEALPYLKNALEEYHTGGDIEVVKENLMKYYTTMKKLRSTFVKDSIITYLAPLAYMITFGSVATAAIKMSDETLGKVMMFLLGLYLIGFTGAYLRATHRLDKWYLDEKDCIFSNAGEPLLPKKN